MATSSASPRFLRPSLQSTTAGKTLSIHNSGCRISCMAEMGSETALLAAPEGCDRGGKQPIVTGQRIVLCQVVWRLRFAVSLPVVGRCHHRHAPVGTDAHSDHFASDLFSQANTGIITTSDDVDISIVEIRGRRSRGLSRFPAQPSFIVSRRTWQQRTLNSRRTISPRSMRLSGIPIQGERYSPQNQARIDR